MKRLAGALLGVVIATLPGCNWGREGDLTAEEKNGLHHPQLQMPAQARIGGPVRVRRGGTPLGATDAPGPPETMEIVEGSATPGGPPEAPKDGTPEKPPAGDAPKAPGT